MSRAPRRCGPVTLVQPIGSGGTGEVWLGRLKDDTPVVLKRFAPSMALDVDDILDSATLVRGLQLANVGAVLDAGVDDEQAWVASAFVDGLDVRTLLERTRDDGLVADVAALVAADILRGLRALHARGLVHRDVSPANVMLDRDGDVVVVDLDFVCRAGTAATGTVPGTVSYMSPEQAQGLPVDGRADLYAWGIVAYELFTGDAFYGDLDDADILRLARTGGYRPRRFSSLSSSLQQLLARALAPDPTDRFSNAEAVLAALSQATSTSTNTALAELVVRHAPSTPIAHPKQRPAPARAAQLAADISGMVHGVDEPSMSVFRPRVGQGGRGGAAIAAVVVVLVLLVLVVVLRP